MIMCMYKIIAVTNRHLCEGDYFKQIERIASSNVEHIILREKDMPEKEYKELAEIVLSICSQYRKSCILHTYVNVAKELKAENIHLPLPELRCQQGQLESFKIIGTSIHSLEEAWEAEQLGASYITAGHIYQTDCKKDLPSRGLDFLESVCREVSIPVYAIGGITLDKMPEIIAQGATGGCIMSGCMKKSFWDFDKKIGGIIKQIAKIKKL